MSAPALSPRHDLARELERPDGEINLARAALLVAREEYPQLPVQHYLLRLDLLAAETLDRLGVERMPTVVLEEAKRRLFAIGGLRGNQEEPHDPRNCYLNDVLDRRVGTSLMLGIVLLEVGWRLGLPLEGVSVPGHLLVRYRGEAVSFLIDPFHGGAIRSRDEVRRVLGRRPTRPGRQGATAAWRRSDEGAEASNVRPECDFRACTRREMALRLLLHLKGIYLRAGDGERALAAVERILLVCPTSRRQIRDRGRLLASLGRAEEAVVQLEAYLAFAPNAADAERIEDLLRTLRARRGPGPEGA